MIYTRKNIRLDGYDYSAAGAYFITICTQNMKCLFGDIVNSKMQLNESGIIVENIWHGLPNHFPNVVLDEFAIMPNHFHGIIGLSNIALGVGAGSPRPDHRTTVMAPGAETAPLRSVKLGQIVAYLKYQSTKLTNELHKTPGVRIWQRGYHDRVIRDENELFETRKYILENPLKWSLDPNNPKNINQPQTLSHA